MTKKIFIVLILYCVVISTAWKVNFKNKAVGAAFAASSLLSAAEGLDATYDDASGVLTLSTELATSTNIGGASFDSIDFVVTTGQVELNIIDCGTY